MASRFWARDHHSGNAPVKIRALVQAEHWLDKAGVRIRYRRIARRLSEIGASLDVGVINNSENTGRTDDDVIILSKCTDSRALLVSDMLRERGVIVGMDMFDDYFSSGISACHKHREFLREASPRVDFFLCSTDRMRGVAQEFASGTPAHVLNDPFDDYDSSALAKRLHEKVEQTLQSGTIEIVWFGTGNNPTFPVGITDLAAYIPALLPLVQSRFRVHMKVLTNLHALDTENLARLRALPFSTTVEEWSEEGEATSRDQALISFLPVNYQNFSIAKSLNRGISALTGGTQILSAGHDLYSPIGDFVYRDAKALLADLEDRRLRLRAETLDELDACMDGLANPSAEAKRLLTFLEGLEPHANNAPRSLSINRRTPRAVLHGRRSSFAVQAFCRERDVLSIGSIFCNPTREFDLSFQFAAATGQLKIRVSNLAASLIAPELQVYLRTINFAKARYPFVLDIPKNESTADLWSLHAGMVQTRATQMVHYARSMAIIEAFCVRLLPGTSVIVSDQESPLTGMKHLEAQVLAAQASRA